MKTAKCVWRWVRTMGTYWTQFTTKGKMCAGVTSVNTCINIWCFKFFVPFALVWQLLLSLLLFHYWSYYSFILPIPEEVVHSFLLPTLKPPLIGLLLIVLKSSLQQRTNKYVLSKDFGIYIGSPYYPSYHSNQIGMGGFQCVYRVFCVKNFNFRSNIRSTFRAIGMILMMERIHKTWLRG